MSLFSQKEISMSIATDIIQPLIEMGYKIDGSNSISLANDFSQMKATLNKFDKVTNDKYTVIISEVGIGDLYMIDSTCKLNDKTIYVTNSGKYYKVHDNLYSDNKSEADKMKHEYNINAYYNKTKNSIDDCTYNTHLYDN